MNFRQWAVTSCVVIPGILSLVACGSDRGGAVTAPSNALSALLTTAEAGNSAVTVGAAERSSAAGASVSAAAETADNTITSLVAGTSCPTLQFTIGTYAIKTDAATRYEGGSCASLKAGTKITLQASRLGSESERTVYASQITIRPDTTTPTPTPTPTNPSTPVRTEVTITTVTGTCPGVTFAVGSSTFQVSSATSYRGGTCADLGTGVKVSVVGTKRESDTFVVVTGIEVEHGGTPTPPTTPTTPTTVSGEGTVTSLVATTSCPALTFQVNGSYTVVASASTRWEHGACADLAVGAKVELTGTRTGDASIAATSVGFRDGGPTGPTRPAEPVEGEGVITSLGSGTSCPALQFFIGTYLVKLEASTQFVGGVCADLKAGVTVHLKGTRNGDGSVTASTVTMRTEAPRPEPEAEGEGYVTGLVSGTACPTLTAQLGEYTIALTASTQFVGGSCTSIAVGKKLEVRGTMTGEKSATATQITFKN